MTAERAKLNRTWTVAEAKARLSEILRLAEKEGTAAYRQEKYLCRRARTIVATAIPAA